MKSPHREDKQRVSFQSQLDFAPSVQVLNQFDVLQSDVEVETSKVYEKDVLLRARFVGEQQKIPICLIVSGLDNKSSVEQGNSQLPPDFGAAPACRSLEESQSSSTGDLASLVAIDKLLMDIIPAKSCIVHLSLDKKETILRHKEIYAQTVVGLQKCCFFQQGGNGEEWHQAAGHDIVSYADIMK
ncbi:hypothetical protein Nepgr_031813 [Nepenthes gracilis]|uniref:Uncharacterized protein n=1 Tax=Nepenthes gracilis TaxID=150966 RepID=A0AAD3Y765_NEPGR|nr:hypothetical protein Nepgr_031813 [Nepenthes gracilis]